MGKGYSIQLKGRNHYVRYRDARKRECTANAGPSWDDAVRIGEKIASQVRLEKHGVLSPDASLWTRLDLIPLDVHLKRWHAHMIERGLAKVHCDQVISQLDRLIDCGGIAKVSDLLPDRVKWALDRIATRGGKRGNVRLSERTLYYFCGHARRFTRWLAESNGATKHILEDLPPPLIRSAKEWDNSRTFVPPRSRRLMPD